MLPSSAIFLLILTASPSPIASVAETSVVRPAPPGRLDVRLLDLASIRRVVNSLLRNGPTMTEGERAAAWADFSLVSRAVIGDTGVGPIDLTEIAHAVASGGEPRVRATRGVVLRDEAAYQLLALGYSAREVADVVSGRISRQALDTARQMLAVGQSRDAVANYLDGQYQRVALRTTAAKPRRSGVTPTVFDPFIEKYAALHQVEAAVVRAIIQAESAFDSLALSRKGAIGLMQLMPLTARELGVDPFVPEQNIEGGIRYFSQLLRMFGGLELALVAYNGGPGYAQRYARGQAPLYGETRDYVRKVIGRIDAQR
jgi:soluble lytic murein transglycosylase-like protein